MADIREIITQSRAYFCLDCGKCTGVCPVSRVNHNFSPRNILMRAIQKDHESILHEKSIWECLTCGMCEQWCPAQIKYIQFIQAIRELSIGVGEKAECSHGGALQSMMRIMTADNLKQNRTEWIPKDLKVSQKGEYFYFVGCAPFFDSFFEDLDVKTLDSAKGTIKLLNKIGITPVVSKEERCCGHDLLWGGDHANFEKLGRHNIDLIEKSGAKTVVLTCPEGYQTFKQDYPKYFGQLKFDVVHLSELLRPHIESGALRFKNQEKKITFHDPCRLGRHMGVYDAPRKMIESIQGLEFNEMPHSRHRSVCCGVGNWLTCGAAAKAIQTKRLKEAKSTGAEIMVTACPKCEIHLKCALSDETLKKDADIEIMDLTSLASDSLI
ncbi:MAG: (Fe-S)-binding protein [candidate division KSB1 bacterium]|jgi:Fe-S oxidoreductase|nr:(Fe-S)-binding protein [candidate division KSB1 bacterium]